MISEILGYVGTVLVLISFIPKDIKKIRIINIGGCVVWIVSAVFSKSYSVFTLNSILMVVHIIHLIKLRNKKDNINIKPTEKRNIYNALCEDIGLEVDYTKYDDPKEEDFDLLRHGIANHYQVPYNYLYPKENNFDDDLK